MLTLPLPGRKPGSLTFSPDGTLLAIASDERMVVLSSATGEVLWGSKGGRGDYGSAVSFSPDSRRLVRGLPVNPVRDARTGVEIVGRPESEWPGRAGWPMPVGFPGGRSPCGRWAVLSVVQAFRVVADGRTHGLGSVTFRPRGGGQPERLPGVALAFSPDGELLALGGGDQLVVVRPAQLAALEPVSWQVQRSVEVTPVVVLTVPKLRFVAAAFTADGTALLTVGGEPAVRVWDTATWTERLSYAFAVGKLVGVAVSPDGLRAAACGTKKVVVWDLD